ncbi:hypothetical protein [Pedobacter gandavensis]|uniref:Uncharacterized protein n=1 Tax=Pedobacter gandavensis TaxID=2679963 RepID=A0ABR6F2F1_9SPHI|nr:hypothetical protein [Pedobacter gandavensis]MBB2151713.1 hypothetical protein [Pedobacter gandavensis]
MSELLPINIDLTKVEKYKKLKSVAPTFLDKYATVIIPEEHQEALLTSLKNLLTSYNVDHEHLDYFLYIIGQHYQLLEIITEQKTDALECDEPLHFLQGYLQQTEEIKKMCKTDEAVNKQLNNRYIEVISPEFKSKPPVRLHNTDFVVKGVYQLFKQKYPHSLKELLTPYDDIPPLAVVNDLVKENDYIIKYATHYFIPEIVIDIVDYMNLHMEGQLSRKQYLFIFDFIYLWGVFLLVEEEDSQDYGVTTEFKVPTYPTTEKTAYLKKVIHRYKKHIKSNP